MRCSAIVRIKSSAEHTDRRSTAERSPPCALTAIAIEINPPHDVNVIIEVPVGGEPIKYEESLCQSEWRHARTVGHCGETPERRSPRRSPSGLDTPVLRDTHHHSGKCIPLRLVPDNGSGQH